MGAGPLHLIEAGLEATMRNEHHQVSTEVIEAQTDFLSENKTAFELYQRLSMRVQAAREDGAFPIILSGNCGAALGAMSGLSAEQSGLLWFDTHGDFNTPETSTSGFLDGMGLAVLAGLCWQPLAATIPNFAPLPDTHIIHLGGRDFDAAEQHLLEQSDISVLTAGVVQQPDGEMTVRAAFDRLRTKVERVYIHFDVDVLDTSIAPANQFAFAGGLDTAQVETLFRLIADRFAISGVGFSAYDPAYDQEDRMAQTVFQLTKHILALQ